MTDTDRLAALLHDTGLQCVTDDAQAADMIYHRSAAARLIAAGVTLQPPAPSRGMRDDVRESLLAAYRDATLTGLGAIGFNNAEHPMGYYRIPPETVFLHQPAAPADGLREAIAAFFRAYDATHLVHDVAYEGVNDAAAALRAALVQPAAPADGLDVERLAQALLRVVPGYQRWMAYPGTPTMADMDARSEAAHTEALAHAGRIAREYAALTPEDDR